MVSCAFQPTIVFFHYHASFHYRSLQYTSLYLGIQTLPTTCFNRNLVVNTLSSSLTFTDLDLVVFLGRKKTPSLSYPTICGFLVAVQLLLILP